MGIFNFLNKPDRDIDYRQSLPINSETESALNEIPERVFVESNTLQNANIVESSTVHPSDNNIQLLFNLLDRNYESKGYDDALINPDVNHLNQNLEALKNELVRNINKVKTFYEDFLKEIKYHIESRSRSGMIDTVEELKMKKEIAESHIKKVLEIETSIYNNTGDSQGILISYTRGFKNGLAAISHQVILKKNL